jgi:hypothetical protein
MNHKRMLCTVHKTAAIIPQINLYRFEGSGFAKGESVKKNEVTLPVGARSARSGCLALSNPSMATQSIIDNPNK